MQFIPSSDPGVLDWGRNFTDLLTDDPARYGLEAANAALLQARYDDFAAAYILATDPDTKTKPSVAVKDGTRQDFLANARAWAAIIRANIGVTDEDKISLGLNIPDPTPTPIPPPSTTPVCSVTLAGVGVHQMSITDILTPTLKKKPEGVAGMLLCRTVTAAPSEDIDLKSLHSLQTKSDVLVPTGDATPGQYANYCGYWYNRKGEIGEKGGVTSFIIV